MKVRNTDQINNYYDPKTVTAKVYGFIIAKCVF